MTRALVPFTALLLLLPLSASAQGVFSGELGGDQFGASVRGVGDLNSDGYEDFAVGAPGQDSFGSEAGRVYIFFGHDKNVSPTADILLNAGDGGDHFGFAVAGIGRFNNDGYDDLAVGAPDSDAGGSGRGRVYIYFGGPSTTSLTPGPILGGEQGGAHFGESLDGNFDFNNDSFTDLIVGSPDMPATGLQSGQARIFFGGTSVNTDGDVILPGAQAQDAFGTSVSRAGDVNGDGLGDVIVGAPQPFATNSGRAYVIFGRSDGLTPVRLTLSGENGGDRFGSSVGGGGDLDNDGFGDVVVGAPRQNAGLTQNGAIYLYRGAGSMDAGFDSKVSGRASSDFMGTSVSIRGDWDKDGHADLIGGAPGSDDGGSAAGEIDLWLGDGPLDVGSRTVFLGPRLVPGFAADDQFGSSLDFVDYNGDGNADILGGSSLANQVNGDQTGLVSLNFYPGSFVPVLLTGFTITPGGDRVTLEWRVQDDGTLLGFRVERRSSPTTDWSERTRATLTEPDGHYLFVDVDDDFTGGGNWTYRLVSIARDGRRDTIGPFAITIPPSVRPFLGLSYPNPSPNGVTIPIVMPESALANVTIYDAAGRPVRTLFHGSLREGKTNLWWDGTGDDGRKLPTGSYYYFLETGRARQGRKVVVLR